jgi:hypothetical protein
MTHAVPYLVQRDGRPVFAAAASGAGAVGCSLQTVIDVVGHGLPLDASVAGLRWGSRRFDPATGTAGAGRAVDRFDPALLDAVERAGQPLARALPPPPPGPRARRRWRLPGLVARRARRARRAPVGARWRRPPRALPDPYNFDTGVGCAVGVDAATGEKLGVADPRAGSRAVAE